MGASFEREQYRRGFRRRLHNSVALRSDGTDLEVGVERCRGAGNWKALTAIRHRIGSGRSHGQVRRRIQQRGEGGLIGITTTSPQADVSVWMWERMTRASAAMERPMMSIGRRRHRTWRAGAVAIESAKRAFSRATRTSLGDSATGNISVEYTTNLAKGFTGVLQSNILATHR